MGKCSKAAKSVSVIGGSDGPTAIFLAGKKRKSLKQYWHKWMFSYRKKRVVKSIKANPHSIEDVIRYAKQRWHFTEVRPQHKKYKDEYFQLRASFILQYQPQLLGELAHEPKLQGHSEAEIKAFVEQMERRQKKAESVPRELFDIDLHILEKETVDLSATIILESTYGYIGGSASGNKKEMKRFDAIYRAIYQYYGVSQDDIERKTKRYETLVRTLAQK